MKTKSRFTLWKSQINGTTRWGVNGLRDYGLYTVGPHGGFDTRKAALALLKRMRQEDRDANADIAYFKKHPEAV